MTLHLAGKDLAGTNTLAYSEVTNNIKAWPLLQNIRLGLK
jgi:hypothetical protein